MTEILLKIAAGLALLAALFFGERYIEGLGYDRAKTEDNAALQKQKTAAATELATQTGKTRTAEQALQDLKNTQDLKDAEHGKTVFDLSDRLRRAAGPAGRLRDPHAAGCRAGSGSAPGAAATTPSDRAADPTEAGGLLSTELTGLLQQLQREADTINAAYASCRTDAYTVRAPR